MAVSMFVTGLDDVDEVSDADGNVKLALVPVLLSESGYGWIPNRHIPQCCWTCVSVVRLRWAVVVDDEKDDNRCTHLAW